MKRIVNFRSFVYSTIILIAAIFSCVIAYNVAWLGFLMLMLVVFVPLCVAIALKNKIEHYKFVTVVLSSILAFVAVVVFFTTIYTWTPSEIESSSYCIKGVIDDNYVIDDKRVVVLRDATLDDIAVNGKIKVTVYDKDKYFHMVPIGDKLEFYGYVSVREIIEGYEINSDALRSNIRFYSWVNSDSVKISEGEQNLLDKINIYVKNTLVECMGNQYGVIAYGILTGDKNEISSSVRDSFSVVGIAHILAVSGLHIGFLMGIVLFVLRKLKIKKLHGFVISVVILFLYCVFAVFSPSVVRASVMFLVGGGAALLGEERDGLNALGFAVTIILTVSPIMLFEAGFLMSAGAVFGILNFSSVIIDGLRKLKLPQKIAQAVAVSASAQLGILPACVMFFGNIQLYSIIINALLIPIMSLLYVTVFVALILSIIPFLKFLLTASGFLVKGLVMVADFCAQLPLAQVLLTPHKTACLMYPAYFLMGGYVGCKHKKALVISLSIIMVIYILILLFSYKATV